MFPLDYRDLENERHLRLRDLRFRHHERHLAAGRRRRRRLRSLLGRALLSLGRRLVANPSHERARSH